MAVALMVSCQDDCWNIFGKNSTVDVVLKVTSPQMDSTRGEGAELDSALGAIDNFDNNDEFWQKYDLRYILHIYEVVTTSTSTTLSEQPIYTQVQRVDRYVDNSIRFNTRLVPQRKYKFVIWADFVNSGTTADLFYYTDNAKDLRNITRMAAYEHTAMEEGLDAYHISFTEEVEGAVTLNATLTRPMAKLRVVAIDYKEVSSYAIPSRVDVKFDTEAKPVYKVFNAVSNSFPENYAELTYNVSVNPAPYKEYTGTTEAGEAISGVVLFSDYIFTERPLNQNEKNEQPVNFSMDIYDHKELPIRSINFDTDIPLSRNYLTTIVGNFLTQTVNLDIKIDDTLLNHTETFEGGDDYDIE